MRIEPPPSLPVASVTIPPATAATEVADALDLRRRAGGDLVPQRHRRQAVRPPGHLVELLDADRHPAERQRDVGDPGRDRGVLAIEVAEGVQRAGVDRGVHRLELLRRRPLTAAEGLHQRACVPLPWCVAHRPEGSRGAGRARNGTRSLPVVTAYDPRRWTPAPSSVSNRPTTGSDGSCP